MIMKKWIVKRLMNCKWIKEALYEAIYKEYVEGIQKDFNNLRRDHKTLLEDYNKAVGSLEKVNAELNSIKESIMKAFPISGTFNEILSALLKCANVIMPLFPKKETEEEPKKKRKYTKKKK